MGVNLEERAQLARGGVLTQRSPLSFAGVQPRADSRSPSRSVARSTWVATVTRDADATVLDTSALDMPSKQRRDELFDRWDSDGSGCLSLRAARWCWA